MKTVWQQSHLQTCLTRYERNEKDLRSKKHSNYIFQVLHIYMFPSPSDFFDTCVITSWQTVSKMPQTSWQSLLGIQVRVAVGYKGKYWW